ncbi:hypothetical protein [Hyphomonas sp.]|uniref:hypothetical protein n=1 Tax=Hyphomonas sp. TaxID=87 RepID=UPI003528FCDD
MKRLLIGLAVILTACGGTPGDDRAFIGKGGTWGWQDGQGCEDLADAIVINGDWFDIYKAGEKTGKGKFMARRDSTLSGTQYAAKMDRVLWKFVAVHPEDPTRLVQHEQQFSVRRSAGKVRALRSWKQRDLIDPETGERSTMADPRSGQIIRPCEAS